MVPTKDQEFLVGLKTSAMLDGVLPLNRPPATNTWPSGRSAHTWSACEDSMGAASVKLPVSSNTSAEFKTPRELSPPVIKTRPSDRVTEQAPARALCSLPIATHLLLA